MNSSFSKIYINFCSKDIKKYVLKNSIQRLSFQINFMIDFNFKGIFKINYKYVKLTLTCLDVVEYN